MFGKENKLKLINLKYLIDDSSIRNHIDNKTKIYYSNDEDNNKSIVSNKKTSKRFKNIININNYINVKKGIEKKSFSLKIKKNNNKNKNSIMFSLSLKKPFIYKIKYFTNKENKKYREINSHPFDFNNLNFLGIENNKEKISKNKGTSIKGNFKMKIPIKYSFPKIGNDLVNIYNKISSNIKITDINSNENFNKTVVNSSFNKNLTIFTNYIKENANQVIKKRIFELKKNMSEVTKDDNYFNNKQKEEEIKFNVMLLDNWENIKLNNYNPLKNYSVCPIKTELNDFKFKNNNFKKFHIYKKYKTNDKKMNIKKSNSHKLINKIKNFSYEKLINEISNNIFFEYYFYMNNICPDIIEKNENEIKAYLNILYLNVKLNMKKIELNETIKNSQKKIESNIKQIKEKTTKLIENINNVTTITNTLTNDILLHNCQKNFAKIKLRSSYHQINQLKSKFEENSLNALKGEKEGMMIKEAFNSKIIRLKKEIRNIENKINENKESGINYYLNILKEGNENRNVGLSWIVKRLFRLDYIPKLENFPQYISKEVYDCILIKAKNENVILDCLQELGEIKKNLFEQENDNKNNSINSKINYSFNGEDIYETRDNENQYDYKFKLKNKLKQLLDKFNYLVISPEMKLRIDTICPIKTINQIDKFININKIKNDIILQKNYSIYFFKNNIVTISTNDKNILNNIKRVLELKNIIYKSYSELSNLKKEETKYIINLIKDRNGNIIENINILNRKINSNSIKIIRNLIGNENKIKFFHKK